ncbi:hypothetical protein GY45DRAFT_1341426, partial [Cubamyces sp. BRFM 1775]
SFPALEVFDIDVDAVLDNTPLPSVKTIGKLLLLCPRLTHLSLPILQGPESQYDRLDASTPSDSALCALHIKIVRISPQLRLSYACKTLREALKDKFKLLRRETIVLGSDRWVGGQLDENDLAYNSDSDADIRWG